MQATFGGDHRIHLAGNWRSSRGRLEVYHNGRWGTVCDDGFGCDDATLMCRILGHSSGVDDSDAGSAGSGSGQFRLDDVRIFDILNTSHILLYNSSSFHT